MQIIYRRIVPPYYAHSSILEDVTYDMHTTAKKDLFWRGGENDTYLRQADSQ